MSDVPPKQPVTGTDSVRMDTGSALPPFSGANTEPDPVPVTPTSAGTGGMSASAALVSMHNAASQAGSDAFPVLKAFQDYLESERQRARRRMTTLSVVFSIVIIAILGAFILIWFSTMRGMQDTNRQLLDAALKKATAEPPAPVVVQPPAQPSAAETAKIVAEAVSRAQSEQSAAFAKTLEGLNASLAAVRQDNAEMKAEIDRAKAAAAKAEADRLAAEKAAAAKAEAIRAQAEKEAAAKIAAAEKAAKAKAAATTQSQTAAADSPALKPTGISTPVAQAEPKTTPAPTAPKQADLDIPTFDAPPPPEGFSQDAMGVRLPKEPRPISWRVYVPTRAN